MLALDLGDRLTKLRLRTGELSRQVLALLGCGAEVREGRQLALRLQELLPELDHVGVGLTGVGTAHKRAFYDARVSTLRFIVERPRDPRAAELVDALRHEPVEGEPAPVLVAPIESDERPLRPDGFILLAAHRPGTPAYEATVRAAPAPLFVLDARTQRALHEMGVESELLPIGPSPVWCAEACAKRDLDLVVVERLSWRRANLLARFAPRLARWRCALHPLDDLSEPVDPARLFARGRVRRSSDASGIAQL